ncbi:hypothetical protein [Streptomyces acidiscabies]|uniref:hypothetical protein n=1 Tax=Streptomyces acidiscabies TaxID=42234 RepID=UPI0038F7F0AA
MRGHGGQTGRLRLVGAASGLVLALAACGGGSGDEAEVPSVRGSSAAPSAKSGGATGGDDVAEYVRGQRAWVACLRTEGVDVPDPDALGQVDMGDAAARKTDATFRAASEKCADVKPPVPESVLEKLRPELSDRQKETQRRYSACMQGKGAPDFPDPGPDGYLPEDARWNQASAGAKRAIRACAPIIGDPADQPATKG